MIPSMMPSPPPETGGSGERMMDRRMFVALSVGGVLGVRVVAGAQAPERVYRIGVVSARTSWVDGSQFLELLRQGLRGVSYVERVDPCPRATRGAPHHRATSPVQELRT